MNLYRNFGNLLESWVSEGYTDLDFESGACVDGLDSVSRESVPVSIVKSESEDSGFETVSTTSPCHSHQCSGLTSDESHPVFDSTEDDVRPPSPSPSVCSSSSSSVSLGSVAPRTACLKVEEALKRTETFGSVGPPYQCNMASFPTNCHPTSSRPYDRVHPRRTRSQPSDLKKAELYRKHRKSHLGGQTVHLECADGEQYRLDRLSPGLLYLEQVCRMLENFAKLQQQNHSLQEEVEILRSQQEQTEFVSMHEEEFSYPASQSLHILGNEDPTSGSTSLMEPVGFRHRSFTDTQAAIGHHRGRTRFARGKSIVDVIDEEPDGKDPLPENERKKQSKIQKLKFTSFRRQETQKPDMESKSFDPNKKTRVPGIFRRRMTTRL